MKMKHLRSIGLFLTGMIFLSSCNHDFSWLREHDKPRVIYAPNMYYSVAYEPMKQVTDESSGELVGEWQGPDHMEYGEYYNSNPYDRSQENGYTPMNMRHPAEHTVKRGYMPYLIPKDSLAYASKVLKSPFPADEKTLKEGEVLFNRFCAHCHGETGAGDGPVNKAFKGVANLTNDASKQFTEGHIFHVITYGVRRMGPHGSQVEQNERWKIAAYIKNVLQKSE